MRLELVDWSVFVDERGQIKTFIPSDPIVEYNFVTLKAGEVRGLHWHPHFDEYLLFVSGEGEIAYRDADEGDQGRWRVAPGMSTKAVSGVAHAVYAETDLTFIAMLTRRWDESDPPIVRTDL